MRTFIARAVTVGVMLAVSAPALARASPQEHAEFNRLVNERNELYGELEAYDREAARRMRVGENPLELHSRQVTAQDQLDLIELRLDMLSLRYDLPVPPLPGTAEEEGGDEASGGNSSQRSEEVFARGRERAVVHLRQDLRRMLSSIDFEPFLEQSSRASRAEREAGQRQSRPQRPNSRFRQRGMLMQ